MEERINVAEILRNCPKGMELDCTMFDNANFIGIESYDKPCIRIGNGDLYFHLTKFGTWNFDENAKCVIFPKGKDSWEGFVPPCKFKAGDVLVSRGGNIVLFSHIDFENLVHYHCIMSSYGSSIRIEENTSIGVGRYYECVLANEQQRQKMYDRIKYSGYKYNQQNNKLEKLIIPKFKVGDVIMDKDSYKVKITDVNVEDEIYGYESVIVNGIGGIGFDRQDEWELVPDKFDFNTLVPFESRVLVRATEEGIWKPAIWGFYDKSYYVLGGICWKYCIPYEANKELLGTNNNPE